MNKTEQCKEALDVLVKNPYSTTLELHERTGADRYLLARRLPDLEKQGLAKREDKKRPCTASPSRHISLVWRPTFNGIEEARRED